MSWLSHWARLLLILAIALLGSSSHADDASNASVGMRWEEIAQLSGDAQSSILLEMLRQDAFPQSWTNCEAVLTQQLSRAAALLDEPTDTWTVEVGESGEQGHGYRNRADLIYVVTRVAQECPHRLPTFDKDVLSLFTTAVRRMAATGDARYRQYVRWLLHYAARRHLRVPVDDLKQFQALYPEWKENWRYRHSIQILTQDLNSAGRHNRQSDK